MAILWAGGRPESLTLAVGSTFANGSGAGGRDTAYFVASNRVQQGTREAYGLFTSSASFWAHVLLLPGASASLTSGASIISFRSGTTVQLRLTATSNSNSTALEIKVEKTTDGTNFTQLGSDVFRVYAANQTLDFEVVIDGTTGVFRVWRDAVLVFNFTGDVSTVSSAADRIYFSSHHTGAVMDFSEAIVADETTIGMRVYQALPNAAGDTNTWTNTQTAIDDTVYDEADFIETNVVNNVAIFNCTDISSTIVGHRSVKAVVLNAAGTIQAASTPTDVQAVVKTGGSTFTGASQSISTSGARSLLKEIWTTNPNTTAAWTQSELTAIQLGWKAV